MNDLLQWAGVVLVFALAAIWIIRRLRKKPSDSPCSSCDGCELANCDLSPRMQKKVNAVPAVGDGISTDATEVNSSHAKGATAPAGNSSLTSVCKVNASSDNKQDINYKLSKFLDDNGRNFVLNSKGKIEFGLIDASTSLPEAPILLSEGVITNPRTYEGYGLVHIEKRYGAQIIANGYKSTLDFIEEVATSWSIIREENNRNGKQTYRLIAIGKHNNTLMVEMAKDGSYWNINTAGIFKSSYGIKNREIYNRHTTENQSVETDGESQGTELSDTTVPSSMNSPISDSKVNALLSKKQISEQESLDKNLTPTKKGKE